ncbi:enoyl-CoA hydratase/isomerase family protein [Ruegeria jejuensis]|uniref:enoyl-CoA hydratase/isomerase family protein n=1 Tax=Ruegeria jejuensis TaxID=3233338 RepID=UPI00355BA3EA
MPALEYTNEGGFAQITIDNPPQNRLGNEVMAAFGAAIQDMMGRDDTRVLLVKANGPDFGFGGDVTNWDGVSEEAFSAMMAQGLPLVNAFEDLPFPIVFAIQGHCMGGAFELALRGDIIIAADDAKFGHPEATVGVFTFLGGVQRVAERVGRTRAMQWALTAELVGAEDALTYGLINEVVPASELGAAAEKWVQKLGNGPTKAHATHKKLMRAWSTGGIEKADAMMPEMAGKMLHTEDAQGSLVGAINAVKSGQPRPAYPFKGK